MTGSTRPAPYEPIEVCRMWGVFLVGDGGVRPAALLGSEAAALGWVDWQMTLADGDERRLLANRRDAYVVLVVDELAGWAWNDVDPPT